ncbi:glycosyltransferase family 4 protein [Kovacikia minuta CCNUW1]|uniref:glycosyltransferase family 4 protein n=1 Tax=Kovacikia minuta TaxID=2931930 RepID=UPI001CCF423B|nr:glycosyltransferase family 1 protein [Kovacikia minuta]UBF29134.1 glycosyltransferase family 4 protein [Kovacikia minuta CCNUW1]
MHPPLNDCIAMPILVNFSSVLAQPTGLATYSLNLIKELNPLDIDLVGSSEIAGYRFHPSPSNLTAEYGLKGHLKRLLWVQLKLPKLYHRLASDLLFSPIPEAPLGSDCRWIVTVHDLIPLHFPRRFSPATLYNRYYIPQVLRQSVHLLCNSVATANDIIRFCKISANKITPIPLAYDAENFRFLNLPTRNYFLYLGRINPYKNVQRLIAAFAALPNHADYELWLAGPPDKRYLPALENQIKELNLTERVKFLKYVPYGELPKIVNQAIALVFPSLWEGFGLPVLEAMACGTPVITSNLASLPEVAGDAAILVDPYNVGAIAHAMNDLITDPGLRTQLRTTGLTRANHFSWEKTGQETVQVLKQYL